jgi:NAD(P)-dependent dehydrogenase (short-subunit alcohol dehydrogenase family)
MKLLNKCIVVTGASGVLGSAVVQALSAHGAKVAALDHGQAAGFSNSPGILHIGGVDLTQKDASIRSLERVATELGSITGLVNCAGGFLWEKVEGGSWDTWESLYRINLSTAVCSCEAVLPYLVRAGGGSIVNVGALGAVKALTGMGPYAASKAGVIALTQALAEECKDRGITVNAVLPSTIDTPRNRAEMATADFTRWVTPAALAEIICFLFSDAAQAITGAQIPVAGRV